MSKVQPVYGSEPWTGGVGPATFFLQGIGQKSRKRFFKPLDEIGPASLVAFAR
jgi:hypothetical protein